MPFFAESGKATRSKMPGADGADRERSELERKHADSIYAALTKIRRAIAPVGTTTANITPDEAVMRYRQNQRILRDALVAMLTDGAMLGADIGKAQTEWAMGVRKATPTITGVDWDLINNDVLQWVMGGGLGDSNFGEGYANTLLVAMNGTTERGLRTLVGEWVRNDLTYRQLVTDLERSLFSRQRAEMVSVTEITRSFAEGHRAGLIRGGIIEQIQYFTAFDERTCPICGALHGQITDVRGSFGGQFPPVHPRCRCIIQPYVASVAPQAINEQPAAPVSFTSSVQQLQYRPTQRQMDLASGNVDKIVDSLALRFKKPKEEIERLVDDAFKKLTSESDMAIQFKSENLEFLLSDGRFKSQFETNSSSGLLDTDHRAGAEYAGLGTPLSIPANERPIYGFMNLGERARSEVRGYGDITFLLNDNVKQRSTVTVGDSLNNFTQGRVAGTPVTAPTKESWDSFVQSLYDYATYGNPNRLLSQAKYIEIQVHGGVALGDIKAVIDEQGVLTKTQKKELADRGIEVWGK